LRQDALIGVTGDAEAVGSRPLLTGRPHRHAGIVTAQQIKVGGCSVHWRRKPRNLVSPADDAEAGLAEPRRACARILSTGVVVPKRRRLAARHVGTMRCRRWIS